MKSSEFSDLKTKTIMFVEDDPNHVELMRLALGREAIECKIVVARDGSEALDYVLTTGESAGQNAGILPDIILLDLKLPKIDGLQVLKRLRGQERTRFIPVIILTSSDEARDLIESYKSGANSYIRKPIDFSKFCEAIRHIAEYWLFLNEPAPRVAS
jgi:two-component system, response regulator